MTANCIKKLTQVPQMIGTKKSGRRITGNINYRCIIRVGLNRTSGLIGKFFQFLDKIRLSELLEVDRRKCIPASKIAVEFGLIAIDDASGYILCAGLAWIEEEGRKCRGVVPAPEGSTSWEATKTSA